MVEQGGRCRKSSRVPYVLRSFKFPPELWERLEARVPDRRRSAFVRRAIERELERLEARAPGAEEAPTSGGEG
jgi:hypothetical protein